MQHIIEKIICDNIIPVIKFPGIKSYFQFDDPVIDFRFNAYTEDDGEVNIIDLSDKGNILNIWISENGLLQLISLVVYSFFCCS